MKTEELYIDLIKKTLCFLLWNEPPVPILTGYEDYPFRKSFIPFILQYLKRKKNMYLVTDRNDVTEQKRIDGRVHPHFAHTMIGLKRLNNLQF